jgi:hypothetical protein
MRYEKNPEYFSRAGGAKGGDQKKKISTEQRFFIEPFLREAGCGILGLPGDLGAGSPAEREHLTEQSMRAFLNKLKYNMLYMTHVEGKKCREHRRGEMNDQESTLRGY